MTLAATPTLRVDAASKLLDFSQKMDMTLLDQVVDVMNKSTGEMQAQASRILTELKDHPDAWTRVDAILEFSQSMATKYFALQVLEQLIQRRWKVLPRVQCEGIKSFIVQLVIKISSDPTQFEQMKTYLSKLNLVLVQIVKQEWPKNWPTFMTDIVGASRSSESLCMNNMHVLELLSEEVFDFSDGHMTQAKAHHLKQQFCGEFQAVFQLCHLVLEQSENAPLVEATLKTLLKFLNWIPVGYIFETNLVDRLTQKFLPVPMFRSVTLQCLMEIAGITIPEKNEAYNEKLVYMFTATMALMKQMIDPGVNLAEAFKAGTDDDQKYIANLAQFLCTFLKEHSSLVEITDNSENDIYVAHDLALTYMLKISEVDDVEIFKICLDYWNWLAAELYRDCPFLCSFPVMSSSAVAFGLSSLSPNRQLPPRRRLYNTHLSRLRAIMITRMAKPEEVLIVENEQGEVVRELIKDTDSINLYKTMRETLVFLTHLDYADTERIMTERLQNQVNGSEWSWKNLNTLCWAVGSISGAMLEEDEKRFLVTVIRDLLGLCEQKRGKDNKAVIASNIMYVVGQYPRFLRAHWKFLKTVVNKLFEFMHETHEGVQDMACDTFIKIAHKCRRHFVIIQVGEQQAFIDELLTNLSSIICDLSPPQVHVFYEAVGYLISAQHDTQIQENLIERLMQLPNTVWEEIISHASQDMDILKEQEVVKNVANILKTNVAACRSIQSPFIVQLSKIYLDMLNVYKVTSENISGAVAQHGEQVLKQLIVKGMRGVKREILTLISTWVAKAEDTQVILENFVPPLFDAVLFDYQRNVAAAREPKVLSLLAIFVTRLEGAISGEVPRILDAVFSCTLEMINKDLHEFPEHRTNFFKLLQAINLYCFDVFLRIPSEQFKLVIDSVVWAFKHSMRNVAEIGLEILNQMLNKVQKMDDKVAAQQFYQAFFLDLLEHVLSVVTDSSQVQVTGLSYYAEILCLMFTAVEFVITEPLNRENRLQSNVDFIYVFVGGLFKQAFPHLNDDQIRVTVKGFYSFNQDPGKMKNHLRDFLVQIKEFVGEDASQLFLEEREAEIQAAQKKKQAVPGILNPHEVQDDDMRA